MKIAINVCARRTPRAISVHASGRVRVRYRSGDPLSRIRRHHSIGDRRDKSVGSRDRSNLPAASSAGCTR